jgi:hypothetical protein
LNMCHSSDNQCAQYGGLRAESHWPCTEEKEKLFPKECK